MNLGVRIGFVGLQQGLRPLYRHGLRHLPDFQFDIQTGHRIRADIEIGYGVRLKALADHFDVVSAGKQIDERVGAAVIRGRFFRKPGFLAG